MDDNLSSMLEEEGKTQGQDTQKSPFPLLSLLLHKVSLGQHCIQLQDGQLLGLPAACHHYLYCPAYCSPCVCYNAGCYCAWLSTLACCRFWTLLAQHLGCLSGAMHTWAEFAVFSRQCNSLLTASIMNAAVWSMQYSSHEARITLKRGECKYCIHCTRCAHVWLHVAACQAGTR